MEKHEHICPTCQGTGKLASATAAPPNNGNVGMTPIWRVTAVAGGNNYPQFQILTVTT